jgi:regulator of nonsense transcripts 2
MCYVDLSCIGQVISSLHQRFPTTFTPAVLSVLSLAISAPNRAALNALAPEQREKEDTTRVTRQRPILRVCSELALVGIIKDGLARSGGEWIMKALKELVSRSRLAVLPQDNNPMFIAFQ